MMRRKFIADWALLAYGLTAIVAAVCMVLGGCGSGVATGPPDAGQPLAAVAAGPVLGHVGDAGKIASVQVTLTNSFGISAVETAQ